MARPSVSSLLPGLCAAVAFILSIFGGVYCKFLSFASSGGTPITLYFGIWYYQGWSVVDNNVQGTVILETCNNYPDGTSIDSKWKSARAFSMMALIIGGVVTFWALLAGCLYPSRGHYRTGGILYMLCCLFMGLSLLLLDSNACHNNPFLADLQAESITFPSSCAMAAGAKCAIAATVMWFVAGVAALKAEPPQRSPITTQTHDVTYTRTAGPDGTAVVSETVVQGEPVPFEGQAGQDVVEPLVETQQESV